MSKVWPKRYLDKRRGLKKSGDTVGLRKLQFGRYVFQMRTVIPGLTQDKVAKLAGISRSQWIKMEKGQHLPRHHKIRAIADAIRVNIEGLYRKAGFEVPKKYARYDLETAKREFGFALQESNSFQDFINRVQLIWQPYLQAKTGKRQRIYLDMALSQILDLIYQRLTVSQRIKLAYALVQDLKRTDIKMVVPNAQQLFDDLESKMEELRNAE